MAARTAPLLFVVLATLAIAAPASAAPPVNDAFVAAELLSCETAGANGTNVDATKETGEPNHAGYGGGKSVWYRWVAPDDGVAILTATGSYEALLAIYTGATVDGLTQVASTRGYSSSTRLRVPVVEGRTYQIAYDIAYGTAGTFALSLQFGRSPANDDLANAAPLTGANDAVIGSTVHATREPGEPSYSYSPSSSAWWTWTAPSTGGVTLDTAGSGFDTSLGVYTGDTVSGLVKVAGRESYYSSTRARVTFRAMEGVTYRIQVDGSSGGEGAVNIALTLSPPPANDAFAAAEDLGSDDTALATGTNHGASTEPGEPSHYAYDAARTTVWYTWTAPESGALTIRADGAARRALAAYTGTRVDELTRVPNQAQDCSCGPEQIRIRVQEGVTYRIVLDGRYGETGTFNLSLTRIDSPPNDDFDDAEVLAGLSADATGTNVGATQEPGEPVHEENYYDPSVWFTWTAPASVGVTLDTAGSSLNTILAVYTGDAVGALTRVPSTRAAGASRAKRYFRAAAGTTYRIAVDGARAPQGTFSLTLRTTLPPANDHFLAATPLAGTTATADGDTIGATGEPGEPNPGGTAGASVWYAWTAPATGRLSVAVPKSDFGASTAVYTGLAVGSLTRVTSSSYYDYRVPVRQGETYRIAVHGGSAPARGTFSLKLTLELAPANDDFAAAVALAGTIDRESATNATATAEPGEPAHSGAARQSVWFQWTAPSAGTVTLDVGSSYGFVIAAYTGETLQTQERTGTSSYGSATFSARAGVTYRIAVDTSSSSYSGGAFDLALTVHEAPPNDHFADALELSGTSDSETASNILATREAGEPVHYGSNGGGGRSVWFTWTAPSRGRVAVNVSQTNVNWVAAVYTGDEVNALTRVKAADYGTIAFAAAEGVTYRIAVDTLSQYDKGGGFTVDLALTPPPANDDLEDAGALSGTTDSATGNTTDATAEPGEPVHSEGAAAKRSVWYEWTAPSAGETQVSLSGTSFSWVAAAYTGDAIGGLTKVASTRSGTLTFNATPGTTYRIVVDGYYESSYGSFSLSLTLAVPPANDGFADAAVLTGAADQATGTSLHATRQTGEPVHYGSYTGRRSVWYRWTPPQSGTGTVDLANTPYDWVAAVYTGDDLNALTRVASADYGAMTFPVRAGVTYRVAVDTWSTYATGGATSVGVSLEPGPPNDDFAAATRLTGASPSAAADITRATVESGEPSHHDGAQVGRSVWYEWTAPATGPVRVSVSSSTFTPAVAAYTGDAAGSLTKVASTAGGTLSFTASRGVSYRIAVANYYAYSSGAATLALSQAAAPANDAFADAAELTGAAGSATVTTAGASRETGEPVHYGSGTGGRSVWYRWTAESSGEATIDVTATTYDWVAAVYTGDSLGSLSRLTSADSGVLRFATRAGTTYRIVVDTRYATGAGGPTSLALAFDPAPGNDAFADAATLSGREVTAAGTTAGASREPGELTHGWTWTAGRSAWYRWTAPSAGRAAVTLSGADAAASIYTGDSVDALTRVNTVNRDDKSFVATRGTTYHIAVDTTSWQAGSPFNVSLRLADAPANDDFANARRIDRGLHGSTHGATPEAGEPRLGPHHGGSTVWYRWTAPDDGALAVDFAPAQAPWSSAIGVFTGATLDRLERVDRGHGVEIPVTAGTSYAIGVDTGGEGIDVQQEVFTLDVRFIPAGKPVAGGEVPATQPPPAAPAAAVRPTTGTPTMQAPVAPARRTGGAAAVARKPVAAKRANAKKRPVARKKKRAKARSRAASKRRVSRRR